MFRKILATILCLLLALMLPMSSLAATEVKLHLVPGDELASIDMVKEIFDALSLRILAGDESAQVAIQSEKGDVVNAAIRADENGVYVQSVLLGNKTLYFSLEDVYNWLIDLMRQQGADEQTIAQFEAQMAPFLGQLPTPAATAEPAAVKPISGDSISSIISANQNLAVPAPAAVTPDLENDPAMQQYLANIEKNLVITEGSFTSEKHNPADTMTEVTITAEDLMPIFDSQMIREVYSNLAQSAGMTTDELIAMVKDVFSQLDMTMKCVVYTDDDDLVSMTMLMDMKGDISVQQPGTQSDVPAETEHVDMVMEMEINLLTVGDVENVNVTTTMTDRTGAEDPIAFTFDCAVNDDEENITFAGEFVEDDEKIFEFQGAYYAVGSDEDAYNGWLGMLADEEQVTITVEYLPGYDYDTCKFSLFDRPDATAIAMPSWSDRPLLSLVLEIDDNADDTVLASIEAATPESSLQLLQLSETELATALTEMSGSAFTGLFAGLSNLPENLFGMAMQMIMQVGQ